MIRSILPLLLFAMFSAAAPNKQKGPASELDGKWVITGAITLETEQKAMVGMIFEFKGDQFAMLKPVPGSKGSIKVENKANPKRVTFEGVTPDGKPDGKKGGWIYELDGDDLRMASFTNSDGSLPEKIDPTERRQLVWKLKRVKD